MNTTAAPTERSHPAALQLARALLPVGLLLILADVLFWNAAPGLNVGIFALALAAMILGSLRQRPRVRLAFLFALLLACCVQAGIETSFSNQIAIVALIAALAGEVFQPQLVTAWARISEVLWGVAASPGKWLGLVPSTPPQPVTDPRLEPVSFASYAARAAWVAGPAVVLLLIFAKIFGAGNAVFAQGVTHLCEHFVQWFSHLDLSPARVVFWAVTATVALGIFHGTRAPDAPRWWTLTLPRLARREPRLAGWQSAAVLLVLNALFLVINTIDATYLWFSDGRLPDGVTHAQFVHEGVNSLITAVLLSAVIIAGLFQQEDRVIGGRSMKFLAHLWVVQNLLLIAGTFLRLKLYTDAHQLTEKRIYVACFLALVTVGFLLLAQFVQQRRSFNWLLGRNAVATLALFFILQFANVDAWVAQTNIARWSQRMSAAAQPNEAPWIDVDYLFTLGPGAWPTLQRLSIDPRDPTVSAAVNARMTQLVTDQRALAESEGWQSWQARQQAGRNAIGAFIKRP
jgi:hypothetical protein